VTGWDRDALQDLRAAVWRRDLAAIPELCEGREPDDVLQLAGDALLGSPLAREWAERLRRRDLEGDAELAAALSGEAEELRPLPVDLDGVSMLLDGDPVHGGGRIDLTTGEIWPGSPYDEPIDDDEDGDPERWLWVEAGSRAGWSDMAAFAATVADPALADRLEHALHGRGPFRRFRAVLDTEPAELTRFHQFAGERSRGRARRWLAEHGIRPVQREP
jgi:hypothetical protein